MKKKRFHQRQIEELCEISFAIQPSGSVLTAFGVLEQERFERGHPCKLLASPMSFVLIQYCTNISFPLPQCTLSMADWLRLAIRCQLQARKDGRIALLTSAGVIKSVGFVHCVALVTVL